jgi:hypothetical protein
MCPNTSKTFVKEKDDFYSIATLLLETDTTILFRVDDRFSCKKGIIKPEDIDHG